MSTEVKPGRLAVVCAAPLALLLAGLSLSSKDDASNGDTPAESVAQANEEFEAVVAGEGDVANSAAPESGTVVEALKPAIESDAVAEASAPLTAVAADQPPVLDAAPSPTQTAGSDVADAFESTDADVAVASPPADDLAPAGDLLADTSSSSTDPEEAAPPASNLATATGSALGIDEVKEPESTSADIAAGDPLPAEPPAVATASSDLDPEPLGSDLTDSVASIDAVEPDVSFSDVDPAEAAPPQPTAPEDDLAPTSLDGIASASTIDSQATAASIDVSAEAKASTGVVGDTSGTPRVARKYLAPEPETATDSLPDVPSELELVGGGSTDVSAATEDPAPAQPPATTVSTTTGKPFLGVGIRNPSTSLVTTIHEGTTAQKLGIRLGDTILSVNGEKLSNLAELRVVLKALAIGDATQVTVVRGDRLVKLGPLPLGTRPQP